MEKFDVIIIGSGLGGLQCGYILAKQGMKVCVLEKNSKTGGCMQTFNRGENIFDTGFHYVGGLSEGQPLNRLFKYFDLMHLPWHKMDEDCFDKIIINHETYSFANGYERFAETLSRKFPHQQNNIKSYASFLQEVSDNIFNSFVKKKDEDTYSQSLFTQSAYNFLSSTIDDPLLRNVLSGASLKMELDQRTLPLYTFAQINSSFIQSAWRLQGGGSQIPQSLIKNIESMGGEVCVNAKVTKIIEEGGKIIAVEKNGEERIYADYFISDIHPTNTLSLIDKSDLIHSRYCKRINNLMNTYGMFTVNIALKDGIVPYQNHNIYIYRAHNVWRFSKYNPRYENTCALVSFQVPPDGSLYTRNIDILTPMYWSELEQWEYTTIGNRSDDYIEFKNTKAQECIKFVTKNIPELKCLKTGIENFYTSTPLSYRDYTNTVQGSAYGVRKNYSKPIATLLSPRTPEPNLFLTGQNLNLHGVLGVSMTSFLTCAEIIGMESVRNELNL